ncbi:MAG: amidohydrolase family protein [Phycisphaerales bacterium]
MLQGWNTGWNVRRIDAAAAIDGAGLSLKHDSGVSAVIDRGPDGSLALVALGPTAEIAASSRWAGVPVIDRRTCLLTPGLVNAHTHLDLTHIGPQPHDPAGGFAPWIDMVRRNRLNEEVAVAESVRKGIGLLLAGGTVLVGDIAGAVGGRASPFAARALADDGRINGVAFVEFFAQGQHAPERVAAAHAVWAGLAPSRPDGGRTVFGVQPHAPYSVSFASYGDILESVEQDTPVCTHLAESVAEHEFIAKGTGPFRALLESIGAWDPSTSSEVGRGRTPVEHLRHYLSSTPIATVHCNDVSATDLGLLAHTKASILYCPRSSVYFAAERDFGPHRYREMLAAGVTVALGTDSIVNLDTPDRISVWDEMRLLARRDGTDPVKLLAMGTVNGAAALRRDKALFTLARLGPLAGLLAIPVPEANRTANPSEMLEAALRADRSSGENGGPELVAIGRV